MGNQSKINYVTHFKNDSHLPSSREFRYKRSILDFTSPFYLDSCNKSCLKALRSKDLIRVHLPDPYYYKSFQANLPMASDKLSWLDLIQKADQVYDMAKLALEIDGVDRDPSHASVTPSLDLMIDSTIIGIPHQATTLSEVKTYLRAWKENVWHPLRS